ncbi:MAG: Bax inhibitor-1/YccA family protein [bacterium]
MNSSYEISRGTPVAAERADVRSAFISRTYSHLFAAIGAFALIEAYLFSSGLAETIAQAMLGTSWLLVLGGFILVSWLASRLAYSAQSTAAQYGGLAAFVVAEAIVFVPLLFVAQSLAPGVIQSAAMVTLLGFTGLTALVFYTRRDFSFLGNVLKWGGILALVLIVAGVIFGFQLGTFFSVAMIGLAGAAILYDTSNVLREFPADRHVAAALQLFASVAMMFWYVLRLFLGSRD